MLLLLEDRKVKVQIEGDTEQSEEEKMDVIEEDSMMSSMLLTSKRQTNFPSNPKKTNKVRNSEFLSAHGL